jgi:predicted nucleotidyltransferase
MDRESLLPEIKSEIFKDYPSAQVIFFGSRARGDERSFSDWDILILIEKDITEIQKIELHDKLYEIELKTGEVINAIIHTRREWNHPLMRITPFYQNVEQEGVPV